jgi:hypothetical protein
VQFGLTLAQCFALAKHDEISDQCIFRHIRAGRSRILIAPKIVDIVLCWI